MRFVAEVVNALTLPQLIELGLLCVLTAGGFSFISFVVYLMVVG